jgi:hypothetical protein
MITNIEILFGVEKKKTIIKELFYSDMEYDFLYFSFDNQWLVYNVDHIEYIDDRTVWTDLNID